ncbi:hypothetical protein B0H14DRAFT_3462324 [Mycena olivaceomarginata]|nr:hypothetical protein B0H14DRAFT_3462324 [Mycena olivaceomarginata]
MYLLSLHVYAPKCGPSPFICLGSFVGSKDDGDAPPWTSILKPGQTHYFLETTAFAATVMCGMTDIKVESVSSQNISSRMCLWARSVSAGTRVEADVAVHCDQLEKKESERQGDACTCDMGWANALDFPHPIFMALLTDSSSVNLPPDTIENRSDVSNMNRPIANSKDVIAPKVKAVESADGTMNTSRRPRLVRRIAPRPGMAAMACYGRHLCAKQSSVHRALVNLALWPENLEAHLSTAMIEWAGAISVGTWAQSCSLGPQKPTTPNNFKPIRPLPDTAYIRHAVHSGGGNESLICIVDSDYESDEPESDGEETTTKPANDDSEAHQGVGRSLHKPCWHPPLQRDKLLLSSPHRNPSAEAEGLSYSQQILPMDLAGDNSTEGPLPAEDENNPDPFYIAPKATQHLPTATEVHPNRAVYLIYVVVFWLHSQFHLPFRACNALFTLSLTRTVLDFRIFVANSLPSYTSCPMSYSLINLPAHLRYRTANLLLAGIMAWTEGAIPTSASVLFGFSSTSSCGRLVRVALVAVVCDKAAAHKLGGFGSHSHTNFLPNVLDHAGDEILTGAFQENGFRERTNAQHRELQKEYLKCTSKSARDAFVKRNATRWSELHHLPTSIFVK